MTRTAIAAAGTLALSLLVSAPPADAVPPASGTEAAAPRTVPGQMERAGGSVTIGQAATVTGGSCSALTTWIQTASSPAGVYAAPFSGVITSFSYNANGTSGQIRALVFAPTATAGHYTLEGKSELRTVIANSPNSFPTRLPVQAGRLLGLQATVAGMNCSFSAGPGETTAYSTTFNPDASTSYVPPGTSSGRVNIAAVVEPDADGDGYGDVSQDACPQSAAAQSCPAPETTITKKPLKRTARPRIKVTFTSSVAGSSFRCSLDGHRFKGCTSPYRKRLAVGKHKLLVEAVSPLGVVETEPAKVKVRVVPHG